MTDLHIRSYESNFLSPLINEQTNHFFPTTDLKLLMLHLNVPLHERLVFIDVINFFYCIGSGMNLILEIQDTSWSCRHLAHVICTRVEIIHYNILRLSQPIAYKYEIFDCRNQTR